MAKKKDEHHGGAWKVAYADFVTAMMALFIVLWICKEKPKLAAAIQFTFKDPFAGFWGGSTVAEQAQKILDEEDPKMTQEEIEKKIEQISEEIQKMINKDEPDDSLMEVQITSDGLKIMLFDNPKKPFFETRTAKLTKWGEFVMESLSWIIEKNKLNVLIDGYVAKAEEPIRKNYGLWELSIDRATSCRRALINYACSPKLIFRVTGFGDSKPLEDTEPESEENDRMLFTLSINPKK
jgi:chemotaxis protein MotB